MNEHTYQSLECLPVRQVILMYLDQQRAVQALTERLARLEEGAGPADHGLQRVPALRLQSHLGDAASSPVQAVQSGLGKGGVST